MKNQQFFYICIYHIEKIYYKVYYILNNIMGTNGGDCNLKKIGAVVAAVSAVALVAFILWDGIFNSTLTKDFFAMDTVISIRVTGRKAEECTAEIVKCVNLLDSALTRHKPDSEISLINKNGGGTLSDKTAGYFRLLLDVSKKSGGAFDFTLGAVSDLWGFGKNPSVPDEKELAKAISESGYENVSLSGNEIVLKGGVVDFGAAGKGIALDEIRTILDNTKAKEAIISVGGSVLIYGKDEAKVGIRDPYGNAGRSIATLTVSDFCVSTSGSYERCFEENGTTYHHILNPETGFPVDNELISVTVVSQSGALSDALSTACFVLGIEDGIRLAKEYGCEAVFITKDKTVYASDNIIRKLEITDNTYTLKSYES